MASPLSNPATDSALTLDEPVAMSDFAALSALLLKALAAAVADRTPAVPASFAVEFAAPAFPDQRVEARAAIERATRTLVFAAAEARAADGTRLAVASAVFKVRG